MWIDKYCMDTHKSGNEAHTHTHTQAHREGGGGEQGILPRGPQTCFEKRGPMRLLN